MRWLLMGHRRVAVDLTYEYDYALWDMQVPFTAEDHS